MTHTHSDRKDLNLPMALLKESKDSDLAQMLLRFAVCIKCAYGDSRMPDVSESAIQKLLSISPNKAKVLLEEVKNCFKLFQYNPKTNSLLAKNFTKPYSTSVRNSRGFVVKGAYCYKLEIKKYTDRQLKKKFREILIGNVVNAKERKEMAKDEFHQREKYQKKSFIRTSPVSQYSLQAASGRNNRKAVFRDVKQMEEQGKISVTHHPLKYVGFNATQTEEMEKRFDPQTMMVVEKTQSVCYKPYNEYKLADEEAKRFRHVIFNHRDRLKSVYVKPTVVDTTQYVGITEVDGTTTPVYTTEAPNLFFGNGFAAPTTTMTQAEIEAMLDAHDSIDRKFY